MHAQHCQMNYTTAMRDIVILVSGAGLPSAILIIWFYRMDRDRPEPFRLIGKSILLGFLVTIPVIFIEMVVNLPANLLPSLAGMVWTAFVTAAFVEEGAKYLILKRCLYHAAEFDSIMDGIVYAACISLGFAFAENVLYGLEGGWVLIVRAFTAVPLHASATGIMGYWFGMAKRHPAEARFLMRKGFVQALVIHGLYDFFLFTGSLLALGALVVLGASIKYLLGLIRTARRLDSPPV